MLLSADAASAGFIVTPPHLALCAILRLVTSADPQTPLRDEPKFTAQLVQFCIRQRRDSTSLKLPSLNKLLTSLTDAIGYQGDWIGEYCGERLSRLTHVTALKAFIESLKQDLDGENGISPLLLPLVGVTSIKVPRYSPVGVFLRECIASFEEMRFEDICSLASDIAVYCPSMLDQEQTSQYLADASVLQKHFDVVANRIRSLSISPDVEKGIHTIQMALPHNPEPIAHQHDLALLRKDFTEAMRTLNRYSSYATSDWHARSEGLNGPEDAFKHIQAMSLKLASLHSSFDHVQASRLALDEAFESAKKHGDESGLLSCLLLFVQIMIQKPYCPSEKEEEYVDVVDRLLKRCCEKSRQSRLPHILAFSVLCKSLMALKHGIVDGHVVNPAEVHRVVMACEKSLRRLRTYVSAGSTVLMVRQRPLSENRNTESHKLFQRAFEIFAPGTQDSNAINNTVDQLLVTMQGHVAASWKRVGHPSLSIVSLLSTEVAFARNVHRMERADALAHVAILETERKGSIAGRRILSYAEKLEALKDQPPLRTASKYLMLDESLRQTSPDVRHSAFEKRDFAMQDLAAWNSHRAPSSAYLHVTHESMMVRYLLALGKTEAAERQMTRLESLCDEDRLPDHATRISLLRCQRDAQLNNDNLTSTYLSEAGAFIDGANWSVHTAEAIVLFCKSLAHAHSGTAKFMEKLLMEILPFVLSESSLTVQADVIQLLLNCKIANKDKDTSTKAILSILKHAVRFCASLGQWGQVRDLCVTANGLLSDAYSHSERSAFIKKIQSVCHSSGLERTGLSFRGAIWPEDLMDLD